VAVERSDGAGPLVAALPSDRPGLRRSGDLDLIALRGTHTAALQIDELALDEADVIALDARAWLPGVRPAFLGLQCGLSIGLARTSLAVARQLGGAARAVLEEPVARAQAALDEAAAGLRAGLDAGDFVAAPVPLFRLRIRLAEIALAAVQLELQASGGRAYHRDQPLGFARRWREAAFLPIVTPSLVQLQGELLKLAQPRAAA
jgi:alkylation response protein AidB-like acyl-CoA dehydrogenase